MFILAGLGLNPKNGYKNNSELSYLAQICTTYIDIYTNTLDEDDITFFRQEKILPAEREFVESYEILHNKNSKDIMLLVSGDPLFATTHHSLLLECKRRNIEFKIINNVSIHTAAISLSGLQSYKFGRSVTITVHEKNKISSTYEFIKNNLENGLHTLILADPANQWNEIKRELQEKGFGESKIIVLQRIALENRKIYYRRLNDIKNVEKPFCIVLPASLHFFEKEFIEYIYMDDYDET